MVALPKVINGIRKFIECEFLPKVTGLNRWIIGAGISMLLENSTTVFNQLKQNDFIKMLKLINDNDEIDIERLYENLIQQARKSTVVFSVPLLGNITLKDSDVEKLYDYIKEA